MKKFNLLLLLFMMSLTSYSQIFSSIRYLDKFDDCVRIEEKKTLITKTDSTYIVEEKGRKPIEYYILNFANYASEGDKDNIVDLTGTGVYGFQICYCVIKMSDKDAYFELMDKVVKNENNLKDLEKYWLFIVHRTISRYSFEFKYDNEFIWIQNELNDDKLGKDIKRIIYMK